MKYRPITDLSDDEVREAFTKFMGFATDRILEIKRVETPISQVNLKVALEENEKDILWTCIRDPFEFYPICNGDKKKRYQYFQWCLAKGVCCWLKDNPYLEAENEAE